MFSIRNFLCGMTLIRQDLTFSPDFTAPILAARPSMASR
jgi:hypothetical protein